MRTIVPIVIVMVVLLFAALMLRSSHWTGIQVENGRTVRIGTYRTSKQCRLEVAKLGGWCGKGCTIDGNGSVSECHSVFQVPHEASHLP